MIRTIRFLAALIALPVTLSAWSPEALSQEVLRIAAVVNDEVISVLDLQGRIRLVMLTSGQQPSPELERRLAPQVLRGLIDERLQLQEAKARSIDVSDADLASVTEELERSNNLPRGGLEPFVQRAGIPMDTLLQQLKARIAWQRTVNRRMRQSLLIGEEEIDDFLAQARENQGQPENLVAEIFLAIDNPENEPEVRQNAERLAQQARQLGDIRPLARQFSDSASSASGGDLGWVRRGQVDPALESALEGLAPGQVSAPIRTVTGYHVIQLRSRRIASGGNPDDRQVQLRQVMLPLAPNASAADVGARAVAAKAFGDGVTGCADLDRAARDKGLSGATDLGLLRLADLAPGVRAAVADLPVGKASAPIRLDDGFSVMMVCARADAPGSTLSRDDARRRLAADRFDAQARRYLRDLRQAAFIDIRI